MNSRQLPTKSYAGEPVKTWQRQEFDDRYLAGKEWRERAEIECTRDLAKSIEQLLCDYHDIAEIMISKEQQSDNKSDAWYLINAQKRMVSMMARVTVSNERLSERMLWLTIAAVALAVIQVVFCGIQLLIDLCVG